MYTEEQDLLVESKLYQICKELGLSSRISNTMASATISSKVFQTDFEESYQSKIHLGSYNYSGLSGHPEIIEAALQALKKYGTSTSGVRLLNGTIDLHLELENKLAQFLNAEDAATFSSGFAANIGVLSTICSKSHVVFSDKLNHQSIVDGLRLSQAKVIRFKHNDMTDLQEKMMRFSSVKKIIVTDGVFSMDGDICNLPELRKLAALHNSLLIIDDAHATGALGEQGRGTHAYFGCVPNERTLITGSLSKGLPGIGGFVAGPSEMIESLRFSCNPYIFSASLPGPIVAALIKSIEILEKNPEIQTKLHEIEVYFRQALQELGFHTLKSTTPIIPVMMASSKGTLEFSQRLFEAGFYVNPVIFPAVSLNSSRLRLNASAALSKAQIDLAVAQFSKTGKSLGII